MHWEKPIEAISAPPEHTMNIMPLKKNAKSCLDAARALIIAMALLAGFVCGPACSGSLCPSKSKTHSGKPQCHGMIAHEGNESSFAGDSRLQHCNLAAAGVAMLTKPVAVEHAASRASHSAHFDYSTDDPHFALGNTANLAIHAIESPPRLPTVLVSTVVLRV